MYAERAYNCGKKVLWCSHRCECECECPTRDSTNESIAILIGANANVNSVELTEDVDVPSQIRSRKDISYLHSQTACRVPHVRNLSFRLRPLLCIRVCGINAIALR